ncbi:DeoR family transcriptional regulator [uncultured Microbacterium sp.]|uniref:DeoR family transcriptional regulator n=1 Tax=uncultured Microbacterium sp. TaxID=191216 RepID=UPI002593B4A3|nr:DeoR family transcriptional regulator [uncultured Microbacterium sp.]
MLQEAVRRGVQDLGGERVGGPRGSRTGEHGQSDPLADHRHVPFAEDRPGRLFETREKEIAAELGLSEDSIRRDLRELDAAGLAVRVYGGALPASPAVADYATTRVTENSKRRVAAAAAARPHSPSCTRCPGHNPAQSSHTARRSRRRCSTTPSTSL